MSGHRRIVGAFSCAAVCVSAVMSSGCGGRGGPVESAPEVVATSATEPAPLGARFVAIGDGWWVDRADDGTDLHIVGGGRLATKDGEILAVGAERPVIDGGIAIPPWARTPGGHFRYMFWHQNRLYGAEAFTGELTYVTSLPGQVRGGSPWLDGVALSVESGLAVVDERGVVRRPRAHGAAAGLAADAKRAVVQTLLGSTLVTSDGGDTFRDVTSTLGDVSGFVRVGEDLELGLFGGGRRYLEPSGELSEVRGSTGPRRDRRPPRDGSEWPTGEDDPYSLAVSSGVVLSPDVVLIVGDRHYAKLTLSSGTVSDVVELPDEPGDCEPMQIVGEPLLLCVTPTRAAVYTLRAEPVLERGFPLAGGGERSWQADQDRFAAVPGEALGFVGPCGGESTRDAPDVTSGASTLHRSRQHSREFCVRAGPGRWIEHDVGASDADAVIAWVPRRHGAAAVIVGRNGTFLGPEDRVETTGGLLVVRVALEEPPLEMSPGMYQPPQTVSTRLRVAPDGAIEGWLSSSSDVDARTSVRIDRAGHVVQHPVPSDVMEIGSFGRYAIGSTDGGELFESVDWGKRWHRVAPVPGHWGRFAGECTSAGCRFQGIARLGWDGRPTAEPRPEGTPRQTDRDSRPPDERVPLVRLTCAFDGAPTEKRMANSHGFGVTPQAITQRIGAQEVGKVGWVWVPNTNRFDMPLTGMLRAAWLRPLDVQGEIRRTSLSLKGLDVDRSSFWLRVGYALRKDGTLDPFVASSRQECSAPLFTRLGILSPMGGCHGDQSIGVEVGGRVVIATASSHSLQVTAVQPDAAPTARFDEHRALVSRRYGYVPERKVAIGRRGDDVFVAAFDAYGDAARARIDLPRGRLGPEQALAGLSTLALANHASCRKVDPDDATYLLQFEHEVGLSPSLHGVTVVEGGIAVIRWSKRRACLEAIELNVRDQHLTRGRGRWVDSGTTNKVIARFGSGTVEASSIYIGAGAELRQSLTCTDVSP